MSKHLLKHLENALENLQAEGLYKHEYPFNSPQAGRVQVDNKQLINMCSNNYLGLASDPQVIKSAHTAVDKYGYGLASVRFICGTQNGHIELEKLLSEFLNTEASILFSSCFDANGGVFEALLDSEDCIISDALNHASIIDGIRLCKAKRMRYQNNNMVDLEQCLQEAKGCKNRLIVTDGVFSMDGTIAHLDEICSLAEKYDALVMVDDSHATGFVGETGRGTPELFKVQDKIDILTGTFGKALGGASGGFVSGKKEIIGWLRQRSRPYLFSNSLAPIMVQTTIHILERIMKTNQERLELQEKVEQARSQLKSARFNLLGHPHHPIIPILVGDAKKAKTFADNLLKNGVFAIGFVYPVVPMGKARVRLQISHAISNTDLNKALQIIIQTGQDCGLAETNS